MLRKIPLFFMLAVAFYLGLALAGLISAAYADDPNRSESDFDVGRLLGKLLASEPLGDDPTLTAAYLPSELVPRYYEVPSRGQAANPALLQPARRADVISGAGVRRIAVSPAEPEVAPVKLANWDLVVARQLPAQAPAGETGLTLADAITDAKWRKAVAKKLRNRLD